MQPIAQALAAVAAAVVLAGCSLPSLQSSDGTVLGWIKPYHIEVVQGNVVTKEQAEAVRPGMSKAQVRDVLGSPLLTDPFHADRWDYVFTIRRAGTVPQERRIVVLFDGETLKTINAPDLPSEREFVDSIDVRRNAGKLPTLALTDEQIKRLPVPKPSASAASAAAADGPSRTYPPLEPVAR